MGGKQIWGARFPPVRGGSGGQGPPDEDKIAQN